MREVGCYLCPAAMRARLPVPGILMTNQKNIKKKTQQQSKGLIKQHIRRLHLSAESGCVRMERRADIKDTCLLLVEMMVVVMSTVLVEMVVIIVVMVVSNIKLLEEMIVLIEVMVVSTIMLLVEMMVNTIMLLVEMSTSGQW